MSFQRPDVIEQIRAEVGSRPPFRASKKKSAYDQRQAQRLFRVCTANRWMRLGNEEPQAKMLFGEFWFENELCILFADTNIGKSLLAVQIANSLSKRSAIKPFGRFHKPLKVLYLDFELSTKQFCARYRKGDNIYNFSDNFCRGDFNAGAEMPDSNSTLGEFIVSGIEDKLIDLEPAVLIIDNITCLRGGIENASAALNLMKMLQLMKRQYRVSILVLAHTPKRNPIKPLTINDLQGSKMLTNFADSAFAIGRSTKQKGLCYIKQVKQRSTVQTYGEDNVCLCSLQRTKGFLRFRFKGNGSEKEHLLSPAENAHEKSAKAVLHLSAKGYSQRQISGKLGISVGVVNKMLKVDTQADK